MLIAMAALSYSFCISMLHSIWQAGLLWLIYTAVQKVLLQHGTPVQKKAFLFSAVVIQVLLSALTFFIYYARPSSLLAGFFDNNYLAGLINTETAALYTPWLFSAYLVAVTYRFIKSAVNWWGFKKQFAAGRIKPYTELKMFTQTQKHLFGINRKVQLWFSNTLTTPVTFGFLNPVIVLPVALVNQISLQQAETLILHELAHIKANDFVMNWLLVIAESLFFFNPFVTALCNKLKLEREKHCDVTVTAFKYPGALYAEALLKAQLYKQHPLPAAVFEMAAVGKQQHLLQRIQFFTNPANQLGSGKKNKGVLAVAAFIFTMSFSAVFTFQLQKQNNIYPVLVPPAATVVYNENATPLFINNLTAANIKKTEAAEKIQPLLEKKIEQLQPLVKEIENKAAALSDEAALSFVTPVAAPEIISKQLIIKEQQSGSKNASVKVYTLTYKNGSWLLQPQWKLAAKEILLQDSLLFDSSAPPVQSTVSEELQD